MDNTIRWFYDEFVKKDLRLCVGKNGQFKSKYSHDNTWYTAPNDILFGGFFTSGKGKIVNTDIGVLRSVYWLFFKQGPFKMDYVKLNGKRYIGLIDSKNWHWTENEKSRFICKYWVGKGKWTTKLKSYIMFIYEAKDLIKSKIRKYGMSFRRL